MSHDRLLAAVTTHHRHQQVAALRRVLFGLATATVLSQMARVDMSIGIIPISQVPPTLDPLPGCDTRTHTHTCCCCRPCCPPRWTPCPAALHTHTRTHLLLLLPLLQEMGWGKGTAGMVQSAFFQVRCGPGGRSSVRFSRRGFPGFIGQPEESRQFRSGKCENRRKNKPPFSQGFVLSQLPSGLLVNSLNARHLLLGGVLLWSVATVAAPLALAAGGEANWHGTAGHCMGTACTHCPAQGLTSSARPHQAPLTVDR
jgi:hypothetical protein